MTKKQSKGNSNKNVTKSYVGANGKAVISCPGCKRAKAISTQYLLQKKSTLNIRCSCDTTFKVILDYRQSYRKPTDLVGKCHLEPIVTKKQLVKIKNLSLGGARIELIGKHNLSAGQQGYINFELDDKRGTSIRRVFSIATVSGNTIGCEFKREEPYEKELGYYLRPS